MSLNHIGGVVVNLCAQKDDAVHHQAREHVHLSHIEFALFNDGWRDVAVAHLAGVLVKCQSVHAEVVNCKFSEIVIHVVLI